MKFKVADEIFSLYPETIIGVVVALGMNNSGDASETIHLLRQQETSVIDAFRATDVAQHPCIASWREAYRKFGAKPQKYYSSVESLVRRVVSGQEVPSINNLVNIYNAVSLKYIVPAGGEDLDQIQGDVELTIAGASEAAIRLLGERDERPPKKGEVFYKDDVGAICRRWNWREADRTKLTENTKNAMLVVEGLSTNDRERVEAAVKELAELIETYNGGKIRSEMLDKNNQAIELM